MCRWQHPNWARFRHVSGARKPHSQDDPLRRKKTVYRFSFLWLEFWDLKRKNLDIDYMEAPDQIHPKTWLGKRQSPPQGAHPIAKRFTVDLCYLNKLSVQHKFHIKGASSHLANLIPGKVFNTMDFCNLYSSVNLTQRGSKLFSFNTKCFGSYSFLRIPQGCWNISWDWCDLKKKDLFIDFFSLDCDFLILRKKIPL